MRRPVEFAQDTSVIGERSDANQRVHQCYGNLTGQVVIASPSDLKSSTAAILCEAANGPRWRKAGQILDGFPYLVVGQLVVAMPTLRLDRYEPSVEERGQVLAGGRWRHSCRPGELAGAQGFPT